MYDSTLRIIVRRQHDQIGIEVLDRASQCITLAEQVGHAFSLF